MRDKWSCYSFLHFRRAVRHIWQFEEHKGIRTAPPHVHTHMIQHPQMSMIKNTDIDTDTQQKAFLYQELFILNI